MRNLRAVLSLFLGALSVTTLCAQVPKEWKQIYDRVSETIVRNDIKAYMTWMDPKFINVQDGKTTTFAPYKKMFIDFMKPFSNIKAKATPTTFAKKGKDVVIAFHYTFSGDYMKKGKKTTLRFYEDGVDTWRKSKGRYLEVVEKITKQGLLSA